MTNNTNTPEHSESTETAISYSTGYKQPFRVLNCYAGIGGNRKLWNGPNMQVTANLNLLLLLAFCQYIVVRCFSLVFSTLTTF